MLSTKFGWCFVQVDFSIVTNLRTNRCQYRGTCVLEERVRINQPCIFLFCCKPETALEHWWRCFLLSVLQVWQVTLGNGGRASLPWAPRGAWGIRVQTGLVPVEQTFQDQASRLPSPSSAPLLLPHREQKVSSDQRMCRFLFIKEVKVSSNLWSGF